VDSDVVRDLRRRYWPLVLTACEWRAYEVEPPEDMAERVFATLNPGKVIDLRVLFRAVDTAVAQAYRTNASHRSSLDAIRGMALVMRRDADRPAPLVALSVLRERDRLILQHAYWDDLDPSEIAVVLRTEVDVVQRRLDDATKRFAAHLARRGAQVDDPTSLLAAIKPGTHHRRP
jgi:hypothetical protein